VRDHHRGDAEVVRRPLDHLVDVLGRHRIEAGRRLVVEQDLRPVNQRAGQPHPLALPAGELGRELLLDPTHVLEVEPLQQIAHPLHHLGLRQLVAFEQREGDVLDHVHRVEQRGVLEHHSVLAPQLGHLEVVERHHVDAVDPDLPGIRLEQPHEVLHQHRLPLPRAADDDVGLAALDVEVDTAEHVLRREGLVQAADANLPALVPPRQRAGTARSPDGGGVDDGRRMGALRVQDW
jgi:hypothetical protein